MKVSISGSCRAVVLAAGYFLLVATSLAGPAKPTIIGGPIPIFPEPIERFGLSGDLAGVTYHRDLRRRAVKLKGALTIRNKMSTPALGVTASVYLSEGGVVTDVEPIVVMDLASYRHGNGNLKAGAEATIPLHVKIPPLVTLSLSGEYLVIRLAAHNVPTDLTTPVVYGPLP